MRRGSGNWSCRAASFHPRPLRLGLPQRAQGGGLPLDPRLHGTSPPHAAPRDSPLGLDALAARFSLRLAARAAAVRSAVRAPLESSAVSPTHDTWIQLSRLRKIHRFRSLESRLAARALPVRAARTQQGRDLMDETTRAPRLGRVGTLIQRVWLLEGLFPGPPYASSSVPADGRGTLLEGSGSSS